MRVGEFTSAAGRERFVAAYAEAMRELRQNVEARIRAAEDLAREDLARRILEPVAKMAERLGDRDAVFHDSLVENILAIAEMIPAGIASASPTAASTMPVARRRPT